MIESISDLRRPDERSSHIQREDAQFESKKRFHEKHPYWSERDNLLTMKEFFPNRYEQLPKERMLVEDGGTV